jgi:Stage II sporulation protein E (SpoIIE)
VKPSTSAGQLVRPAGGLGRSAAGGRRGAHRSASARARGGVAGVAVTQNAALTAFKRIAPRSARTTPVHPAAKRSSNPLAKLGGQIPLPIPVPDWSKPIIIALLLLAAWFGVRSRLAGVRARRLERQRAMLLRDVGAMQAALVPEVPALLGGLAVSVAYRPAEGPAAGGDFYDLFAPEPGKVAMMLGDVAGHGHSALTHAALTRYTLRAYLQAGLEPRAALALAGRVLADPLGERYATVAVGVFDTAAGTLTYSLAGHPPPIVNGVQAREPVTRCSSPPVGWGAPTGRRQTTISLPAGAAACFFSDGLIEARSGGELLGRERLREIVAGLGSEPGASDLLERVRAAAEGAPDDMVACVLSPEPTAAGGCTHVEELEADSQALCKDEVRRFLEECLVPASKAATVVEQARAIADSHGSAVLRVELPAGSTTATATAAAPGSATRHAESPRDAGDASEPLFEALLAG